MQRLEELMKRQFAQLSVAAILCLLGVAQAIAAEYTFVVPIAFRDLPPDIREVSVLCSVHTGTTGPTFVLMGEGTASRPVTARAFSGEITVDVNRNSGESRRPNRWTCSASLLGQVDGRPQLYMPINATPTTYRYNPNIPSAAGTPVVIRTTGELK
jgi:hypothetical protein